MANNSLNDLSSVSNTNKPLHLASEKPTSPLSRQQIITNSNIWAERFRSFTEEIENEIIAWCKNNAVAQCSQYRKRIADLEKFSDGFDAVFNDLTCEWVSTSGILAKGAEGFDLFKAADELYTHLRKKHSFKLEDMIQVARLESGYVRNDEDPESGGY